MPWGMGDMALKGEFLVGEHAMRARNLVLPWLLVGSALAGCSGYRSGYAYGAGDRPGYYSYEPSRGYDTYSQSHSDNDWFNHRGNSSYWTKRSYEEDED